MDLYLSVSQTKTIAGRQSVGAQRTTYTKSAMIAALMSPEIGTVTNQAMKMFLNRHQSTDFLERNHPTATTDPTCVHTAQKSGGGGEGEGGVIKSSQTDGTEKPSPFIVVPFNLGFYDDIYLP